VGLSDNFIGATYCIFAKFATELINILAPSIAIACLREYSEYGIGFQPEKNLPPIRLMPYTLTFGVVNPVGVET
jgi:hypothetical protein